METGYVHCYQLVSRDRYNYTDALAKCNADDKYLARIQSQEQFDFVRNSLPDGMYVMA